jgi:inorganic triphosphatase YgiF
MSRAWPVEGIDPGASLGENARRILAVRMAEFYSYAPIVRREEEVTALHDLRIAAKRLRYSLELFRAVFGAAGEEQIERVKAIQEELGQIHDHDVRIALVEDELAALKAKGGGKKARARGLESESGSAEADGADPRSGLVMLLGRQRAARRGRHAAFVALWDRCQAEGMREALAALSARPAEVTGGRD